MRLHKTRSTRDRSIPRSLQGSVSTKSSISQLTFFHFIIMTVISSQHPIKKVSPKRTPRRPQINRLFRKQNVYHSVPIYNELLYINIQSKRHYILGQSGTAVVYVWVPFQQLRWFSPFFFAAKSFFRALSSAWRSEDPSVHYPLRMGLARRRWCVYWPPTVAGTGSIFRGGESEPTKPSPRHENWKRNTF